jgi:1,2-phenylacetyl-CoA epoxidase catalytic subunit
MPGKVPRIGAFGEWVGLFEDWRKEVGVNTGDTGPFRFEPLYGAIETTEIQFGHYKGQRKWEKVSEIPTQNMRDSLLNIIVYQGDTEFASVEQQRCLLETAPTDWDRRAIARVMVEEMRHGLQMCSLLIEHFGHTGKIEAQKMLERRAYDSKRLLNAFNEKVDNWMDFYAYTDFVDRDGKFQLKMLEYSAFAPLGRSSSYMLREEAFHLGIGDKGLRRIIAAGVLPPWLMQKYFNKWISECYDLFGTDHSSTAHWAYVWGLKGRYDEPENSQQPDLDDLNDYGRRMYRQQVVSLVERFNKMLKSDQPAFFVPDIKFNRTIGRYATTPIPTNGWVVPTPPQERRLVLFMENQLRQRSGVRLGQKFDARTGEPLDDETYYQRLGEWLPTPENKTLLMDIISSEKNWILSPNGARDPLETIGQPRKAAINL